MKKTITISETTHPETKEKYKALYIDGQMFDWYVDRESLAEAKKFAQNDPFIKKSIYADIQSHFMQSFCDFIGRKISLKDLNESLIKGTIDC